MGLLFSKLWSLFGTEGDVFFCNLLQTKSFCFFSEHKIVIVGLDNAGKTTILYQFLMNEVVHTSPTIGSNVEEVVWRNIHFIMWDLGGQQSLRAAWSTYYTNTEVSYFYVLLFIEDCNILFLVCNSCNRFNRQRKTLCYQRRIICDAS